MGEDERVRVTARRNAEISEEERLNIMNEAVKILMRGYMRYLRENNVDSGENS